MDADLSTESFHKNTENQWYFWGNNQVNTWPLWNIFHVVSVIHVSFAAGLVWDQTRIMLKPRWYIQIDP